MTAAWCRWARPQELFETPEHTFVGYFIGSPGMNVLDAAVEGDRALRRRRTTIALGASYGRPQGRVQIGIRPEFVQPRPTRAACRSRSAASRMSAATASSAPSSRAAS